MNDKNSDLLDEHIKNTILICNDLHSWVQKHSKAHPNLTGADYVPAIFTFIMNMADSPDKEESLNHMNVCLKHLKDMIEVYKMRNVQCSKRNTTIN